MAKKLLMLTTEFPPFPGGIATFAYNCAITAAKAFNFQVDILGPKYSDLKPLAKTQLEGINFFTFLKNSFSKKKYPICFLN
jgi:hypothetical protein